ncbi:hypothetical protein D5086_003620 [Populus alba]|uniref:Uncharacterized protein n=1 Tax=Populus alba TaxID=43335 RepID=A0ACC4D6I6_POPAL
MGGKDSMFRYADSKDKLLMFFGVLGSIGDGLQYPLTMYVLSHVINEYGSSSASVSIDTVNKYSLKLLYVAIAVGLSAFVEGLCWTRTAERQTSIMRMEYLKSVLRQQVGFFDTQEAGSSTTHQVVSTISNDANSIQVAICDKAWLGTYLVTEKGEKGGSIFVAGINIIMGGLSVLGALPNLTSITEAMAASTRIFQMIDRTPNGKTVGLVGGSGSGKSTVISLLQRFYDPNEGQILLDGHKGNRLQLKWWRSQMGLVNQEPVLFATSIKENILFGKEGASMDDVVNAAKDANAHDFITKLQDGYETQVGQFGFQLSGGQKQRIEAGSMTNDLSKGGNAIRSVLAILDRKSEIDPNNSWGALDIKKKLKGQVEFNNVFFAYPTRPDQMIFKGLNLKIDAGKTMALVGPSGYGKSTVIGLIERFYDPMKGTVFIDGQDVKSYKLRLLRSHIALVSQEPTLFAGTVRENIAYGKEDARESEIRKAAVLANAHEFIRGVQLSGGQKQRIALARAIIKDPSILLLDEATSALDSVSESLVQDALEKMMVGRTCVVIAHRLSTIQKSNCISVIKNGKVVEQGSHSELMELGSGGAYYSLTRIQSGSSSYH